MTCNSCIWNIENRLSELNGIIQSDVKIGECTIEYDEHKIPNVQYLIDQLTFDEFQSTLITMETVYFIHVLINVVRKENQLYTIERLKSSIINIIDVKFVYNENDNDCNQIKIKYYNTKQIKSTDDLLTEINNCGYDTQLISPSTTSLSSLPTTIQEQQQNHHTSNGDIVHQKSTLTPVSKLSPIPKKKLTTTDNQQNKNDAIETETCFFQVLGMSCASCVSKIQKSLSKVEAKAEVKYDPEYLFPAQITNLIQDLGFTAKVIDSVERGMDIMDVNITGMTCASCVSAIQTNMTKVKGIVSTDVSLLTNRGRIKFDASLIGPRDILEELDNLGFPATVLAQDSNSDNLEKMHRRVTHQWKNSFLLAAIFGIPAMVIMLVFTFYYEDHGDDPMIGNSRMSVGNLVLFLLATPVQIISGRYFYIQAYKALKHRTANMDVLIVVATTISYAYSIIVVIVNLSLNLPSPIVFFDVPPILLMFVSLGRWLEHIAKGRTSEALKKLLALQAPKGTLVKLDSNGTIVEEKSILSQLIQRNDLLKVLPGETIPTDGTIIDGTTTCDEAMLTGESMPVDKTVEDQVVGGTKNINGQIIMKATHVGQETALKHIIKLIEDAQTSRAPIQEVADTVAGVFVPVILLTSLTTLIIYIIIGYTSYDNIKQYSSYGHFSGIHASQSEIVFELAFRYAITVLCIACPCALGLATPTAVMVGTGVGARNGILIKGGEPLETARKIRTIVFDKTGTITKGKPSVIDKRIFIQNEYMTLDSMIAIAGTAESGSEHPLGLAVRNYCKEYFATEQLGRCQDFKAIWGYGLSCKVTGIDFLLKRTNKMNDRIDDLTPAILDKTYNVLIGNRKWMMRNKLEVDEGVDKTMVAHEQDGHTAILIAVDDKLVGMIAIADEIKPSAPITIYALQSMGLNTVLLTGDNVKTARAIAAQVGIKNVFAEVLPADKERFIAKLKEQMPKNNKVAMVGDGINDSPALARSDVGIAIGTGADVAVEAASIVLIRDDLFDVVGAIFLSKKTVWRIRLNLMFSAVYNLVGIPIAAAGIQLMPWMASAAMALSSVSVVTSSLLLRYFKKPRIETYENSDYQEWSLKKASDINVHRGIDNLHRGSITGIKHSMFGLMINGRLSAVKHHFIEDSKVQSLLLSPQNLPSRTQDIEYV
ncbi:unnamed protein product [Didymodactylos carnosus]|uniref:P-type Cu(+) transporter n=2 Tax=Didymodactylos carnosus TaxID=1234261 RepID=A0A814L4S0_9BILA|nr:unnamed protein product [Didymodactylos carnosus]CAF3827251.1 unnamed protein product [Didymodactylos carnosus]